MKTTTVDSYTIIESTFRKNELLCGKLYAIIAAGDDLIYIIIKKRLWRSSRKWQNRLLCCKYYWLTFFVWKTVSIDPVFQARIWSNITFASCWLRIYDIYPIKGAIFSTTCASKLAKLYIFSTLAGRVRRGKHVPVVFCVIADFRKNWRRFGNFSFP